MKEFAVMTYEAQIEPHPNADRIELCRIGDYQSIVQKRSLNDGDVVAYIPEAAIVPDGILERLGLTDKLAGKNKNRVKAIKLRGVLSQGLILPMPDKKVGEDVTEELGIIKYEPPVPQHFSGRTLGAMFGKTLTYPLRNIKQCPDELKEGENVIITEKLHGTWCCCGYYGDTPIVTSKGLSSKGIVLDPEDSESVYSNVYSETWQRFKTGFDRLKERYETFYVLGEIFGRGIQDLQYNKMTPEFAVFDIFIGEPNTGIYLDVSEVSYLLERAFGNMVKHVPILYCGPYSKETLMEYTSGRSMFGGNIREGVVVKASPERLDSKHARAQYKSISEDYLLRKGGSEFN